MLASNSGQIRLRSGRKIQLESLRQWAVYANLLNGLPTVRSNQQRIDAMLNEERQSWGVEPYLIAPVQRQVEYHGDKPYPFGEPAALPAIGCVGYFTSLFTARNPSQDYSGFVVVWFQDTYAFPIDPAVQAELEELDWDSRATDFWF